MGGGQPGIGGNLLNRSYRSPTSTPGRMVRRAEVPEIRGAAANGVAVQTGQIAVSRHLLCVSTKKDTPMIRTFTTTAAVLLSLAAGAALASDNDIALTDEVASQIRTSLTSQGYEVGKIKTEDGLYEAYAKKDGHKYEVYLNAALEIVKTEMDD